MVDIFPADNKKYFREFINFPFTLYAKAPLWVPPLISEVREHFSEKNPFFRHAEVRSFIAVRDGRTAGRITAIRNQLHIDLHGEAAGFFGYFDCIDDKEVARRLIETVKRWLGEKGMTVMRGPMNFSLHDECGVLLEGFDQAPVIMMPYNFPYYDELLKECGLRKAKDLYAYSADVMPAFPEKVYRVADIASRQGISIRPISRGDFEADMMIFKNIYDSAWEKNWGHIPMTVEEVQYMAKKLRPVIDPELALIAEHGSEAVGFMMFLPDLNQVLKRLNGRLLPFGIFKALWYSRKVRDVRLLLLGVKEGYRSRGVDSLLYIQGLKRLHEKGYRKMELSWVLEDNYPVRRIIETMNGEIYKKYRIYEGTI